MRRISRRQRKADRIHDHGIQCILHPKSAPAIAPLGPAAAPVLVLIRVYSRAFAVELNRYRYADSGRTSAPVILNAKACWTGASPGSNRGVLIVRFRPETECSSGWIRNERAGRVPCARKHVRRPDRTGTAAIRRAGPVRRETRAGAFGRDGTPGSGGRRWPGFYRSREARS